jgi:hypothetical protein
MSVDDVIKDIIKDSGSMEQMIDLSVLGDINFLANTLSNLVLGGSIQEAVNTASSASGVLNVDLSLGHAFTVTLTENVTSLTFSNIPGNGTWVTLALTQDATGSRTFAWPASTVWVGGAPTLTVTANAKDLVSLITFDGGTVWYAFAHLNFVA